MPCLSNVEMYIPNIGACGAGVPAAHWPPQPRCRITFIFICLPLFLICPPPCSSDTKTFTEHSHLGVSLETSLSAFTSRVAAVNKLLLFIKQTNVIVASVSWLSPCRGLFWMFSESISLYPQSNVPICIYLFQVCKRTQTIIKEDKRINKTQN